MDRLKKLKKSILFITIIYLLVFILFTFILRAFNLAFHGWFYEFSILLVGMGIVAGGIQLILKLQNKLERILVIILYLIILAIISAPLLIIFIFNCCSEHIVEKDGVKMVAYVSSTLTDTDVEYYDYKNFLITGTDIRITEHYSGCFDPLSKEEKYTPKYITYYDENGKIIKNESGNSSN